MLSALSAPRTAASSGEASDFAIILRLMVMAPLPGGAHGPMLFTSNSRTQREIGFYTYLRWRMASRPKTDSGGHDARRSRETQWSGRSIEARTQMRRCE